MRKKLFIIGATGFGRELLWTAGEVPSLQRDWEIAGFIDPDVDWARKELSAKRIALPVLSSVDDYEPLESRLLICAFRSPRHRLATCEQLRDRGAQFASVIHPTARVHPSAKVGTGLVMRHLSGLSPNSLAGDFVTLDASCGAAHDVELGDGCTLGAHSDVMGGATLGRGVWMGSHSVVLPNARVGDFAVVGVGSVVLRRVAPNVTVFGVPAKRLDFSPTAGESGTRGAL